MTGYDRIGVCGPVSGGPADVKANTASALRLAEEARAAGADLLLLPRLSLTGAGCGDLFRTETLLQAADRAAGELARACGSLLCLFGLPLKAQGSVWDVCAAAAGGRLLGLVPLRPTGAAARVFAERGFPEGEAVLGGQRIPISRDLLFPLREGSGLKVGIACLGLEQAEAEASRLAALGADIIAFPDARQALAGDDISRQNRLLEASSRSGRVCLYANAGGNESSTDAVYDGQALIAAGGILLAGTGFFSGETASAALRLPGMPVLRPPAGAETGPPPSAASRFPYAPPEGPGRGRWCAQAMEICARGLAARLVRAQAGGVVVGVSGGLDSAMALVTSRRALQILGWPPDRLHAVTLPGPGTTLKSRLRAERLAEALGLALLELPVTDSVRSHLRQIGHPEDRYDAVFENAQARERAQVLMDLANARNALVAGSPTMSELALGFTTFGGDHLSMYALNAGLYKTAVRMILKWFALGEGGAVREALCDILAAPVSPELLPPRDGEPAQHTEAILGPYEVSDFYLYHFLAAGAGPGTLLRLAGEAFGNSYSRDRLLAWMELFFRRFFASQFKRSCSPDGPQVLPQSLSPRGGLVMPSDASAALWLEEIGRLREGTGKGGLNHA